MWEKMPIEGAIHVRSHSIPLNTISFGYNTETYRVPSTLTEHETIEQYFIWHLAQVQVHNHVTINND